MSSIFRTVLGHLLCAKELIEDMETRLNDSENERDELQRQFDAAKDKICRLEHELNKQ